MNAPRATLILLITLLVSGVLSVYSGLFDPAADAPHSRPVYWVMETLRHRGIERRVRDIQAPDLADPALIRAGAGNYDAMCTTCHLKPGVTDSELYRGLYPQPPALATMPRPTVPEHAFWIIKHGIKASGMPAWGKSMDDKSIWGMVAFLQRMRELTPETYQDLVEQSEGHSHAGGDSGEPRGMPERSAPSTGTGSPEAPGQPAAQHDHEHERPHDHAE